MVCRDFPCSMWLWFSRSLCVSKAPFGDLQPVAAVIFVNTSVQIGALTAAVWNATMGPVSMTGTCSVAVLGSLLSTAGWYMTCSCYNQLDQLALLYALGSL